MNGSTDIKPYGLVHSLLFYDSDREYLNALVPFILDGLHLGQPVMAAVPPDKVTLLRDALGEAAADVVMADMAEVGRNPGRLVGVWDGFTARYPGQRIRVIGECVWPGRSTDEYPVCVQYEGLCNTLFADREATALCPYNAAQLGDDVLADARETHPLWWSGGSVRHNADYAPDDALARYNQHLAGNAAAITYTVRQLTDLAAARSFAVRYADSLRASQDAIADLQLIVTELATNSLTHAGEPCRLALWHRFGHIICEARNGGRIDDRKAIRGSPTIYGAAGRGLYLINAMAGLVRTHVTPAGVTIQAYLPLRPSPVVTR